jgi:hypothetical protein
MFSPLKKSAAVTATDLAFTLVALLRTEGHLCNVLTHISSGDWHAVEQAIVAILSPRNSSKKLSNIARNILELVCDDHGVTGRIMRPFFFNAIARIAGEPERKRLERKIRRLRCRMSLDASVRLAHPRRARKSGNARCARQIHFDRPASILGVVEDANGARP